MEEPRSYFLRGGLQASTGSLSSFFLYHLVGLDSEESSTLTPGSYFLSYNYDGEEELTLRALEENNGLLNSNYVVELFLETTTDTNVRFYFWSRGQKIYLSLDQENRVIPSLQPQNFTINTVEVNPWGFMLAGVNYTLQDSRGVNVDFLLEMGGSQVLVSLVSPLVTRYYVSSNSNCLTKTDSLQAHLKWAEGLNNIRAWTTMEECQEGAWYRYCQPTLNCGNNGISNNCKGACPTGNFCAFLGGKPSEVALLNRFICVNSVTRQPSETSSNTNGEFLVIFLIAIGVIVLIAGLLFLILIKKRRSKIATMGREDIA